MSSEFCSLIPLSVAMKLTIFAPKPLSVLAIGATFTAFVFEAKLAAAFNPAPLYDDFATLNTVTVNNGDDTDIYYPVLEDATPVDNLPIALFLQGVLVDKSFYSDYASQVARYGFAVVVPNHLQFVPGFGSGLFPEVSQVDAVLDTLKSENTDPSSSLFGKIDTGRLGLLGHSLGGAVGLSAIANECVPLICFGSFKRPSELMAGAFFGANLRNQMTQEPIPIRNDGIGVALLQGDQDSRALPSNAQATFDNIATPPNVLVTLAGVNHFGITNVNMPSGAIPDPNMQTLDQTVGIETTARWSGLFLRGTLLEERGAFDYVFRTGEALDPNVSSVSSVEAIAVSEPSSWFGNVSLGLLLAYLGFCHQRGRNKSVAEKIAERAGIDNGSIPS